MTEISTPMRNANIQDSRSIPSHDDADAAVEADLVAEGHLPLRTATETPVFLWSWDGHFHRHASRRCMGEVPSLVRTHTAPALRSLTCYIEPLQSHCTRLEMRLAPRGDACQEVQVVLKLVLGQARLLEFDDFFRSG